ncbi:class 1 isoprenoid biosynthesis enzyme [Macrococcoides caseolyticum]|uniref:class 1 isoprenoid biosynthesis enzyme n=1 Tax=Macrococcoides caseolyticum TaxID=69966 RepID=UPI001F22D698|nr:class 1 isoprenoid biosynthesis enzyme [Macrococcus caseolyticus]MCE4957437.1 class 1 isoprenoid biosynthesis enzyme [Macrococcus caseolyticus]
MLQQNLHQLIEQLNLPEQESNQLLDFVMNKIKRDSWGSYYETINALFNTSTQADMQRNSVAVQLIFWAFDLVDDVVDGDVVQLPLSQAQQIVLSHIVMLQAIRLLDTHIQDHVMRIVIEAGYAEFSDITFTHDVNHLLTEDDYLSLVEQKSGKLMQLIGIIIDQSNLPLQRFMSYIGIAAQIKNDIDSILSFNKSDFDEKKMYLPTIKYIYFTGDTGLQHFSREKIIQSGALEYCRLLYNYYIEEAYTILFDAFPEKTEGIRKLKNEFNF